MSIPVMHDDDHSGRTWFGAEAARVSAAIRLVHEVLVESWAMANAARRRYPYFE
jgi:hypothetical protein